MQSINIELDEKWLVYICEALQALDELAGCYQTVGVLGERLKRCHTNDSVLAKKRQKAYTDVTNRASEYSSDIRVLLMMLKKKLEERINP
jgi:hypothetical protein